ncbi:cytochrome P450 [Streptomyces barkulensis]|uniref:cytochrome P450 n=1 Tax=Streptomyces barkulensis TaxID=1257026 RepID=UPI000C6DB14C|nr:cytochrome P450 [Streptomyces barkulensis]
MSTQAEQTGAAAEETFPYERKCPFSQPEQYAQFADEPVKQVPLTTGLKVWAVTGHENMRQLLTDPRTSASRKEANFPFYFDAPPEFRTETSFIGYDPPEHTKVRRKAAVTFTNRRVQMLRPQIEKIVDEAIDAMIEQGPGVDMHHALSLPVPMTVICLLLGIPYEDHEFFQVNGTTLLGGTATMAERQAALVDVNDYLFDLVAKKEKEPGDDLLSRAIAEYRESGEEYEARDLVNLCRLLMNGGHETTASMISLGTACLLEHPEQLEQLKADPELIGPAVEELVRYLTIGDAAVPRVATDDIELAGATIRKGDGILCLGLTANRDAEVFEDPDELILARGNRRHFGFGHGLHHCIGADLARLELQLVWGRLFERIPTLRLAKPFQEIRSKERAIIYGLWGLPVAWDE